LLNVLAQTFQIESPASPNFCGSLKLTEERKLPHSSGANAKDRYGIIYSTSFAGDFTLRHCGHPACPDDTEHNDIIFASGDEIRIFIAGSPICPQGIYSCQFGAALNTAKGVCA
jgi:hypothetical protein